MQRQTFNMHANLADKCYDMHNVAFFCRIFLLHMQEVTHAKAVKDAAVDNKQDIADSKLTSESDMQIAVGHVDVVQSAEGRYTAASCRARLHACINRACMHMLCGFQHAVTKSA